MRIFLVLIVAGMAPAQFTITATPNPASAGGTVSVVSTNVSGGLVGWVTNEVILLHPEGHRIVPQIPATNDYAIPWAPGTSVGATLSVPASGPGSSGSSVLVHTASQRALRLDVGAATPGFPALTACPTIYLFLSMWGYHLDPFFPGPWSWRFFNTTNASHTFVAGDQIGLYAPGAAAPAAVQPLAGFTVPGNGYVDVPVPTDQVPAGPWTVQVSWVDPVAGPIVRREGLNEFTTGGAHLNLPGGHTVPANGALPIWMSASSLGVVPAPPPHQFVLLAGLLGGTTQLPGGAIVPLVASDPLVLASLSGGLALYLPGNVGPATGIQYGQIAGISVFLANGLSLVHPNIPGLSGTTLTLAGVFAAPSLTGYRATQPVEVTLQ